MTYFTGKTTIITGATGGIGKAIANALFKEGANLLLNSRSIQQGRKVNKSLGLNVRYLEGDISLPETNHALVEYAVKHFGRLDMLVLSAGQLGIGKIHELSIEDWHNTIGTNLHAIFYMLKYAIPHMQKNGVGSIVIIGSVAANHAFPNHPAYSASKGALPALVRQVAKDYGPEIRINLVSPAQVNSSLLQNSVKAFDNPDEILAKTAARLPMKRLGEPEDIALTVLHLLSDKASWITGSHFVVDGGFSAT